MKLSQSGLGAVRLNNLDKMYPAQDILLQSGQLVQYGSGIYAYNNVPLKTRENIENIIKDVLNKYGCIEVLLPTLQPDTLWKETGRWDRYIEEGTMLTVKTENGDFGMAPTAEEAVVDFARGRLQTYKSLPVTFYQIGEKYRNELRPRGYLLRGKSFPMMDAYSFDRNESELAESYQRLRKAYIELFERMGLDVVPVAADSGTIGGSKSEEFMFLSDIGEDTILYDKDTGMGLNTEILEKEDYEEYLKTEYGIEDISKLEKRKAIELGHIFQLGTKYSEPMKAKYKDQDGVEKEFYMGCYGIGVSRTLATVYEKSLIRDKDNNPSGIALPINIAPYLIQIVPKNDNEEKVMKANELYEVLKEHDIEAILDDRDIGTMGSKIKDVKVLGTPFLVVLGDRTGLDELEVENVATGEKIVMTGEELVLELVRINDIRKKGKVGELDIVKKHN